MIEQIRDLDSHEMIPSHLMGETFGPIGAEWAAFLEARQEIVQDFSDNSMVHPEVTDDMEITPQTVWNAKGPGAPGAIDLGRRAEVLDAMGVHSQLIFPTFGLAGLVVANTSDEVFDNFFHGQRLPGDRREFGRKMVRASNDWVVHGLDVDTDRVRVVAILPTDHLDEMMTDAAFLLESGARALWIPAATAPGGMSPADEALGPFWSLVEQHDVPIVLHIGTEFDFIDSAWRRSPRFASKVSSIEAPILGIYTVTTLHYAVENFLTTMVLGGVFERHPRLRFGVIECTASWVGPLARRMDMMVDVMKPQPALPLKPSEYLARNVRVTPFWFEPVDQYFRDYPEVADVYSYSSDYPHVEGGKESHRRYLDKLEPLGDEVLEKFFRTNGELLLPATS